MSFKGDSVTHWLAELNGRFFRRVARRCSFSLRLGVCFLSIMAATVFVGFEDAGNLIWVANGILLSYLLLAPRWRWSYYFATGFAAQLISGIVVTPWRWRECAMMALFNLIEVAIAAFLLRRRSTHLPQFTNTAYIFRFIGLAVLAAPIAAGLLFAWTFAAWTHGAPWRALLNWVTTDSLGMAVATPACIALFQSKLRVDFMWRIDWCFPIALALLSIATFSQGRMPFFFLIYPLIAIILFRFGIGWASASALFVAVTGSYFTLRGLGPFANVSAVSSVPPTVILQLFIASGMFMIYAASTVMENLRATERKLQSIVALHHLVTENSRDVIVLSDFRGNRSYVSPAAERMGGWKEEDLEPYHSLDLVHPEDRQGVEKALGMLRSSGEGALIECRVRKKNGKYIWVESSLHAVNDPTTGLVTGILNLVRDISKRKIAEQKLQDAYHALEELSLTDPLTRLANRRHFDQCVASEWQRARREDRPLSLLLVDVDWFKSYNDTYGHLRGDSCLKQISEVMTSVVTRAGDLVARFGGEEFAVVLPNTTKEGAIAVAENICASLRQMRLTHEANPLGYVTISVGCSTIIPVAGAHSSILIQRADEAMYAAKKNGRNRVCSESVLGHEALQAS